MFKFLMYKIGQFIVRRLSIKGAYQFATTISDGQYFFSFRDRKAVFQNLEKILPNAPDLPTKTREVFRNFGKYLVEFFRMAKELDHSFIREKIKIENLRNMQKALDRGKGVVVVTAHLGNWELGAVLLSLLGYPPVAVALSHKERPVNNLFNQQRSARGVAVIPAQFAVRRCIQILKDNGIVAVVGDRDFSVNHRGVVMDFLGQKCLIPKGPAIFSLKTGAAIVPVFLVRQEDDTFALTIEEPIYPAVVKESLTDGVISEMIQKYLTVIESKIRQYPTQWLMFRKYWIDENES